MFDKKQINIFITGNLALLFLSLALVGNSWAGPLDGKTKLDETTFIMTGGNPATPDYSLSKNVDNDFSTRYSTYHLSFDTTFIIQLPDAALDPTVVLWAAYFTSSYSGISPNQYTCGRISVYGSTAVDGPWTQLSSSVDCEDLTPASHPDYPTELIVGIDSQLFFQGIGEYSYFKVLQQSTRDGLKDGVLYNDYFGDTISLTEVDIYEASAVIETCSDGLQNQDELGVDCGGSCEACPIETTENVGQSSGPATWGGSGMEPDHIYLKIEEF